MRWNYFYILLSIKDEVLCGGMHVCMSVIPSTVLQNSSYLQYVFVCVG